MRLEARLLNVKRLVVREVRAPGRLTLRQLHRLLQVLFGWTDSHLYKFEVGDAIYGNVDLVDYDWLQEEATSGCATCTPAASGSAATTPSATVGWWSSAS